MESNEKIVNVIKFLNPWWETKNVPENLSLSFKRPVFEKLISYLSLDRILVLKGPRRTGKSTLFYQIIDKLIKDGVRPENILYLSLDDPDLHVDLRRIFEIFEILRKRKLTDGTLTYIFLDEVHFLDKWELEVKFLFDRKLPVKFLVSGSAVSLIKKSSESLAGRTVEEALFPFSFAETVIAQSQDNPNIVDLIKEFQGQRILESLPDKELYLSLSGFQTDLKIFLENYFTFGGFPHLFTVRDKFLFKKLLNEDILEKVIFRDLVELYHLEQPLVLERLYDFISTNTAGILNISEAAGSLGTNRPLVMRYLSYLEQAYLLVRLPKYSRSVKETIRSNEKVHVIDPAMASITQAASRDQIFETTIATHLYRMFGRDSYFWRDIFEVDIVIKKEKILLPIEVKNSDSAPSGKLKGVFAFLKKYKQNNAIVVYNGALKEETIDGHKILFYPAWLFLLKF